jgi:hypothetical protein
MSTVARGVPSIDSCTKRNERLLQDGGGIHSTADWSIPRGDKDIFGPLRDKWSKRAEKWRLCSRLRKHLRACAAFRSKTKADNHEKPGNLFSSKEIAEMQQDMVDFLERLGHQCSDVVSKGQPFTLKIWQAILDVMSDVDGKLPSILEKGVPTGIDSEIPASGVWRPRDAEDRPDLELLVHESPWKSGLDDVEGLRKLLQHDADLGFCEKLRGGLTEAKKRFGGRLAAGKLGIVKVPGKDDRLVGDSSISGANTCSRIAEKVELPGLSELIEFLSRNPGPWSAFSLDVSAAHKRIRVLESEQGYNLFAVELTSGQVEWWVYKTCHFGASWSAYWWARTAAAYVRVMHQFLWIAHGLLMYCDDALFMLPEPVAPLMALWALMLTAVLGVPLSWHKLQLDTKIDWIGWDLNFDILGPKACLPQPKRVKLLMALEPMCMVDEKVEAKHLEQTIGLLGWWTAAASWLRPWLQPLYSLLLGPCLKYQWLDAEAISEFRAHCDGSRHAIKNLVLSDVRKGWQLHKLGSQEIKQTEDMLSFRLKNGGAWATFLDFDSAWRRVNSEAAHAAELFWKAVSVQESIPLVTPQSFAGLAAADAFAEGDTAGIGGWLLPQGANLKPENVIWFSEQIGKEDIPCWFSKGSEGSNLQSQISAFEAIGQLALLAVRCQEEVPEGLVGLRQRCDNQGVVAASAKALSMKKPLCYVLQAMGLLAVEQGVRLCITHVAGNRNDWADALSRGPKKDENFWNDLRHTNRRRVDIWQLLERPWLS